MSNFALDWLRLREPHDIAARDRGCAARFAAALGKAQEQPLRVLDLAAGSGSGFRALAPVIGSDQSWTLADHDIGLLDAQASEIARWAKRAGWRVRVATQSSSETTLAQEAPPKCPSEWLVAASIEEGAPYRQTVIENRRTQIEVGSARWTAQSRHIDLDRELDALDFTEFDAITTSAFLDLVSHAWLQRFASKLTRAGRPLLATLTVEGVRDWDPPRVGDEDVHAAFEQHQSRDKGFGPARGAKAVRQLAALLSASDYDVTIARSDWHIGADAQAMLGLLLEDTLHAAVEAQPKNTAAFASWGSARRAQIAERVLSLHVRHLDLLALPAHTQSRTS